MSSFAGRDYDYLFALGQKLFYADSVGERKAIATVMMAMVESVRGQQAGWPSIPRRYRHLTTYPPGSANIIRLLPKDK